MKPVAIGRKNWLFIGSKAAGQRASVLMSLIASCKRNQVEPFAWLRSILISLSTGAELEGLLPEVWLQSNPDHRWTIADRRKHERTIKAAL